MAPRGAPFEILGSGGLDVDGLRALAHAVRLGVEGDLLAVLQGLETRSLKRGDVDENVLRAAFRGDEAKTLVLVEEFYGALGGHGDSPCSRVVVCAAAG